jgi:hypothetical protein
MPSQIWYNDPRVAFGPGELHHFFPTRQMTLQQQLNAVLRLSLYWSVIVTLFHRRGKYMLMFVFTAAATVLINEAHTGRLTGASSGKDGFLTRQGVRCVAPTTNNPHMNVMFDDYSQRPGRPEACDVTDPLVKHAVKSVTKPVPHDDPFQEGRMDRQFYTMPSTTIPNDQPGYASFLYGDLAKPNNKIRHGQ